MCGHEEDTYYYFKNLRKIIVSIAQWGEAARIAMSQPPSRSCSSLQLLSTCFWVNLEAKEEQTTSSDETNKDNCIGVPRSFDVLIGKQKLAQSYTGNTHYHFLIDEYQERYDACATRIEKTIFA